MKNILDYKQFLLKENLSQEQINTQMRHERAFVKQLEFMSKDILTENEQDLEHDTNMKVTDYILSIYDKYFFEKANSVGLTEEDYKTALDMLKIQLDKYRNSSAGKKAEAKYLKNLEKQNAGVSEEGDVPDMDF